MLTGEGRRMIKEKLKWWKSVNNGGDEKKNQR